MATTIALEIKKAPSRLGKFPIYIRITKDRKHKRIKTSVELNRLSDWNPRGSKNHNWVRASERNASKWNDALAKELDEACDIYRDNKQESVEVLAQKIKGKGLSPSFLEYAKANAEELEAQGKTNAKHYKTFCNKFETFLASLGRTDITFSELTPAFINSFESFLLKDTNTRSKKEEKKLHPNYVRAILVKFRALVNKAINEDLLPADSYPFKKYTLPKEIATLKDALEESEIEAIKALDYPAYSLIWHTKNAFLFSFYCAGIRVGDLLQLRWRNIKDEGARLEYIMNKNHKQRNYPLVSQARDILDLYRTGNNKSSDYIFPLLNSAEKFAKESDIDTMPVDLKKQLFRQVYAKNALLNKYLKKVAEDAGINKTLSFHVSRHSFASLAREKAVPSKVVQEALAHSSLATTERYLHSFGAEETASALQKVFSTSTTKQDALFEALKELDKNALKELLSKLDINP